MIRVLRIIEYLYEDFEHQETDMKNWTVPAWGGRQFGITTIYSAIMPPTTFIIREQIEGKSSD